MKYVELLFNTPLSSSFTYLQDQENPVQVGCRVTVQFNRRKVIGYVVECHDREPEENFKILPVGKAVDNDPLFFQTQIDLANWMADTYLCSSGEALSVMIPGGKQESSMAVFSGEESVDYTRHTLSAQQQEAFDKIVSYEPPLFYLHGITGSGKTEVYLHAAEHYLKQNKTVIYLVPEISLTHQLIQETAKRFSGKIAVIHSGITPSQKLTQWRKIINKEAKFIIGARSAIFAPTEIPGLIIIDEEHDSAYKSGATPRYHARQIAMYYARYCGTKVIFGSATPSLEAFNLMQNGKLVYSILNKRLSGGAMPQILTVDMKKEKGCISKLLAERIHEITSEGRQVILFLNRRGFSYFFHCRSCGYEMTCTQCSVSLTYHKSRHQMVCHYCGYNVVPVSVCPECGSLDVGYSGFGTEMIEQEISTMFPELTISRADSDSVKKKGALKKILDDFKAGRSQILIGTQMVAKGLNFPNVKAVGIINADMGLHLPDFRAAERTFALIQQVSGRAGRYFPDGEVIIQTFKPQTDAIRLAAHNNQEQFYTQELELRKNLSFPPFSRLVRLVFRSKDENIIEEQTRIYFQYLDQGNNSGIEILGPGECPLSVISGNFRYQFLLRHRNLAPIVDLVKWCNSHFKLHRNVYLEIDVDPLNLL